MWLLRLLLASEPHAGFPIARRARGWNRDARPVHKVEGGPEGDGRPE